MEEEEFLTADCSAVAYQYADLCIPVEVSPHAAIGSIRTECCGKPAITCRENPSCRSCEIIIEQKIRIKIPIRYTASARIGEVEIDCSKDCRCK
ncbi:MAG: hypothetical protein KH452_14140 [Clostridiales bacterium]|nr:hypothetical protein [Clostridiales bacterium]